MKQTQQKALLAVLETFTEDSKMHQRQLAEQLGVALGAANAHVQFCLKNNLLRKLPQKSGYTVTEKGQLMRCKLLADVYQDELFFTRRLLAEYRDLITERRAKNTSFIIAGTHDISDIAYLALRAENAQVDAFYHPNPPGQKHLDLPIISSLIVQPEHVVLITDIHHIVDSYTTISSAVGRRRVAVPPSLKRLLEGRQGVIL